MYLPKLSASLWLSATLLYSIGALAMPLVGETAGSIKHGMITLYKDHETPNKVYFFPDSTRFAVDENKVPMFNMVVWGMKDPAAADKGGYFSMTTNLASSAQQKKDLESFAQANPQVEIAVIPIKSSSIGLQTTKKNAPPLGILFDEFNFAQTGGRPEDDIGVNAVLTKTGATAFYAMLKDLEGGSPLKMDYCYKFDGLGPNMDAKVHVKMRRVYDYFEANSSGGYWWFSYNIRKVVETLHKNGEITIEMNGGDAKEWEYINEIAREITARLFKPELSADTNIGNANSNFPFRFNVGSITKIEQAVETWTWKRRDLVEREFCTSINIKDLGPYRSKLITVAN